MKTVLTIAVITVLVFFFSSMVVANAILAKDNGCSHNRKGFWSYLTAEQRKAVEAKMKEMRNQNASPEETHTAIAEMLKGYGIDVPGDWKGPHGPGGFFKDLTEEQREAVKAKMKDMRSQNAKPEEIHSAVAEMLKGYGIEMPEKGWGHFGFGRMGGSWGVNLTDEQREAVRDKIEEMRSQGAKREEIRSAIDKMIQSFGNNPPENSENLSSVTAPGENGIIAQSYPNPFNPQTHIAYTLNTAENVRIQIYNVTGQLIRTFDRGYQPAGSYSVLWNGCNEQGGSTASGVYLYRIEAGPYTLTNRMVLLK
jgi:Spy/CpxP family protein refolding chaperone